jgi:hypothetical protein
MRTGTPATIPPATIPPIMANSVTSVNDIITGCRAVDAAEVDAARRFTPQEPRGDDREGGLGKKVEASGKLVENPGVGSRNFYEAPRRKNSSCREEPEKIVVIKRLTLITD